LWNVVKYALKLICFWNDMCWFYCRKSWNHSPFLSHALNQEGWYFFIVFHGWMAFV
jgi:hypothetical protein